MAWVSCTAPASSGCSRIVAMKMIPTGDPVAAARFRAEAEAIARLHHPNVVQVYAVGEHDDRPYLVMEYLSGGSLARRLDGNPWRPHEAARLVEALAGGVDAAHRVDVVHRDLKPSNILLADDDTPKIADYGLVKLMDSDAELTRTGRPGGLADVHGPRAGDGAGRSGRPSGRHPRPGRDPLRADHRPAAVSGRHDEPDAGASQVVRAGPAVAAGARPAARSGDDHSEMPGERPGQPVRHGRRAGGRPATVPRGPADPGAPRRRLGAQRPLVPAQPGGGRVAGIPDHDVPGGLRRP